MPAKTKTIVKVLNSEEATACCKPVTEAPLSEKESVELARVLAALADPVRLRLLSIVASSPEVCSCELEAPLAKSQPTVSHHTKILAEAGLISGEKRGRWMWWHANPAALASLQNALGG
jgi:ArsR family transcriptional regulator, arsenate/arsenite/antimonite-responsive transcriptional repressor